VRTLRIVRMHGPRAQRGRAQTTSRARRASAGRESQAAVWRHPV